ncbi:MAG: peptidoglycan bridge formation glycyltransferase FemA/FemB family protein, partial [Bacteroidales bacterium]|nr:peptidoglycan bridge formation glycyltransferase FemA/FemB family protein [Bacteroidales bacterium]
MDQAKYKVCHLNPDQFKSWDQFVDESPQGDIFCYSWWLDTITKSNFKIFAIFDKEEIVAGIPLAFDKNGKVTEPPLTRTLGPLYKIIPDLSVHKQESKQRNWLQALLHHISPEDVVTFCTHQNFTDWLPFKWKGFQQTTRYTYIIDYKDKDEKELWAGLSRGRKEPIKQANNNGITISFTQNIQQLYELESKSYKRQGLKFSLSYEFLQRIDHEINKRKLRKIFIASNKDGKIV